MERGVTLEYGSHIQAGHIGKYTYIGKYCLVDRNTASIGRFCSIAYHVRIGLGNHPTAWVSSHPFAYDPKYGFVNEKKPFAEEVTQPCVIGNDVWIGTGAVILAGVRVGDGAVIGANALVTKDVEPYSIVIGSPAAHHRYRFDEITRQKLLALQWWDWDDDMIRRNISFFNDPKLIFDVD
ncbi:MAG: CatB-related O-acetyltransferase [Bacteroidales bacterium]|nr:CatB-related O-acetyltransferase [Bacteroidales bacterium]